MTGPAYLTEEWVEAANSALQSLEPGPEAGSVGYRIHNSSGATIFAYTMVLGPIHCAVVAGTEAAGVTLTLSDETAFAIAQHKLSAQREFLNGSMRIDGDINVLLASQERATLADRLLHSIEPRFDR